ncbi:MAG: divergent polysaccharide deacetylase family protein [Alphaproteobacteria bacterium]|nr:divergent polysaccharide deacetylase family protein [Alphaproteobacteria bacterium]MDP6567724.1 divergent polysaccharide deacetylase family protein [Alphaproteobacteria bacterium]MDP6812726.1 divergent polysaccharide deacetylase family protein [Alphaproteobacteria bacterium]
MAKTPRAKEKAARRRVRRERRAPSALTVVIFLLLVGAAATVVWLQVTYVPPLTEAAAPAPPAVAQAPKPEQKAAVEAKEDAAGEKDPAAAKPAAPETKAAARPPAPVKPATPPASAAAPSPQPSAAPPSTQPPAPAPATRGGATAAASDPDPSPRPAAETPKPAQPAPAAQPKPAVQAKPAAPASGGPRRLAALHPAPDPALVKTSPDGPLPIVAPDGRTPLKVYARPYRPTGRPRIAIVVGSLGLSRAATIAAIQQLPGGVTLAFAPYGRDLQNYVNQARAAGHEVLLQLPMEPMDYPTNDPGPHTLLTSLSIHRNLQRLDWLLSRFAGYVGAVNFMGGRFTSAPSHVQPVLEAIRDRGLMFLDARASSSSVAGKMAGEIGLPGTVNDRIIDAEAARTSIDARLLELERLASAQGSAVGIGFAYPVTIERLAQWSRSLGDRGYDLAPVSALAGMPGKQQ